MRKILLGLSLTLSMNTLLMAGPTFTFYFEDGKKSTLTGLNEQRICVSDLKYKLWETGVIPEGYTFEIKDDAMAPIPATQVFKGRVAVNLWITLVKLSKEDKEHLPSSPVSSLKRGSKKGAPSNPCAMR